MTPRCGHCAKSPTEHRVRNERLICEDGHEWSNARKGHQTLVLDTLMGPQPLEAPDGWKFDRTGVRVWAKLVELTEEGFKPVKLKRDEHIRQGRISTLANILANSLGMAGTYWENAAFDIVTAERKKI